MGGTSCCRCTIGAGENPTVAMDALAVRVHLTAKELMVMFWSMFRMGMLSRVEMCQSADEPAVSVSYENSCGDRTSTRPPLRATHLQTSEFIFARVHICTNPHSEWSVTRYTSFAHFFTRTNLLEQQFKVEAQGEATSHSARSVTLRLDTDECVKLTASTSIEKLERQVKLDWVSLLIVGSDCLSRHCADGC